MHGPTGKFLAARTQIMIKDCLLEHPEPVMNPPEKDSPQFGIRVSVTDSDPFAQLVGQDWQTTHWFESKVERDKVMRDMQREHEYSRSGDKPTLAYKPLNRSTDS